MLTQIIQCYRKQQVCLLLIFAAIILNNHIDSKKTDTHLYVLKDVMPSIDECRKLQHRRKEVTFPHECKNQLPAFPPVGQTDS